MCMIFVVYLFKRARQNVCLNKMFCLHLSIDSLAIGRLMFCLTVF